MSKHRWVDSVALVLGLAIFATIALINAPNASIWFDEAFSTYISQFSFIEIAQFTAADVHPPVYYWFLKVWTSLFGTTELAFRSMSILFGAAAIVGAFFLARRFFGRKVAWVTLLFLIISPILIRYSDETRMYTMAATIAMAATLVLAKGEEAKKKRWWVLYGILASLGMWTHYFTAVVWIAHWVWHAIVVSGRGVAVKQWLKQFFSLNWILAYGLAVALYIPWIPSLLSQTKTVQSGFWIGPAGPDSLTNYVTNFFFYLEHNQVIGWWALVLFVLIAFVILAIPRAYKSLSAKEKRNYLLIVAMAWLAPLVLFLLSLPPLSSVFVERYLIPSMVALSIFFAVTLVVGTKKWKPWLRVFPIILVVGMMIFGITNVYKYGNFNKNSNTHILSREIVQKVQAEAPAGIPIVANSPWIFYEAIFYNTAEHPIYFIDEATDYIYGSLDMLRDRDLHKIKDLDQFKKDNPVIWYIGNTTEVDVAPYQDSWQKVRTVGVYDDLTKKEVYKATEYRFSEE